MTVTPFHPGRLAPPDWEHVEKYPMSRLLSAQPAPPADAVKMWDCPVLYDQGQTPRCVGFGTATLETALEYSGDPEWGAQRYDPNDIYKWANANDGIKGPHDGSTTRAGLDYLVKVGAKLAHVQRKPGEPVRHKEQQYLWATSLEELISFIWRYSPGMIGINWYRGMFTPDAEGIIRISGPVDGGHNIVVRGFDNKRSLLILRNTWGKWGRGGSGDAFLPYLDAARLLREDGEAGAIVDLKAA